MSRQTKHGTILVKQVRLVKKSVSDVHRDVAKLLSSVKRNYRMLDSKTKKQIAAGIAGLGVVLAATAAYRKKVKK